MYSIYSFRVPYQVNSIYIWKIHGVELALLGLLQKLMSFLHVDIADHCSSSSSADLSWITSEAAQTPLPVAMSTDKKSGICFIDSGFFFTKSPTENIGWILPMVSGATMISQHPSGKARVSLNEQMEAI